MKLYLKSCERFHWPFDDATEKPVGETDNKIINPS